MAENKTQMNDTSVDAFIDSVADEQKRADSRALLAVMARVTGQPPKMWGDSIVGFGSYHYKYASGREGDMPWTGFSPRKQAMTVYLWYGFEENQELMQQLGKYKVGKACLYFKKLEDIDQGALEKLVQYTMTHLGVGPT